MEFQFATASQIIFQSGAAKDIPKLARAMGTKVCFVTGSRPERLAWLCDALEQSGLAPVIIPVLGEPNVAVIAEAAETVRAAGCDMVIAVGGGSVLDSGKALAALITNTADIYDYLEVVGKGLPLKRVPVPMMAVPTTAGTGSEATANAVLLSPTHGVKVSMRSKSMIPAVALIDPELMLTMPAAVTASTGMDALTQLLEAFVSNKANPMTDALCREGLAMAARSLRTVYDDGSNLSAREDMAAAGLFSGIALANAKLGAVHGFAAPLGGEFHAPHGAVCAALLPHVMQVNIHALRQREPESVALKRYGEVARILTKKTDATVQDGIEWIAALAKHLQIPGLSALGVREADFVSLAHKASNASSMQGNPIKLTQKELQEILRLAT